MTKIHRLPLAGNEATTPMRFGLFTHDSPRKCAGKHFFPAIDGTLATETVGYLSRSQYQSVTLHTLADLAHWMQEQAQASQHLTQGVSAHEKAVTIPRDEADPHQGVNVINRTNSDLPFPQGGGLMCVDSDSNGELITMGQVWDSLASVQPQLSGHAFLQTTSSSSCVRLGDEDRGVRGLHGFFHVADATDIPRALHALHIRLCINGYQRHKIGETGKLLDRSFVDLALQKPSQPIYIRAHVVPPVTQDKLTHLRTGIEVLDTSACIPDLTKAETDRFEAHMAQERANRADEMKAVGEAYIHRRTAELVHQRGITEEQARATISSAIGSKLLMGDFPIRVRDGWISVADILAHKDHWHEVNCYDPLEPEYGGLSTAKIYSNQGQPQIASYAHSGGGKPILYKLFDMPLTDLPPDASPIGSEHLMPTTDSPPMVTNPHADNFFVRVLSTTRGLAAEALPNCRWSRGSERTPPQPLTSQYASPSNMTYLIGLLGGVKWFNCMTQEFEWAFSDHVTEMMRTRDVDIQRVAVPILKEMASRCDIAPETAERALEDIEAVKYHPMANWLAGLPQWDGVDRLGAIADGLPSPNPIEYRRAVVSKWFIQGVQAAHNQDDPQQIPHVLCFSGEQGAGKTRFFVNCAPQRFTMEGATLALSGDPVKDRDSIRSASRVPLAELGELEAVFSKSSTEAIKNYLSARTVTYRMAYGKREITVPRCTIYGGTVNSTGFLRDETGSRRYWPIEITGDLRPINGADLEQVWAQAFHMWRSGAQWFLTDSEQAMHAEIVDHHREYTAIEEVLPETFPLGFWTRGTGIEQSEDDPVYRLMNISEIAKECGVFNPSAAERRIIQHYVEKNGGRAGRYYEHPKCGVGKDISNLKRRNRVFMVLVDGAVSNVSHMMSNAKIPPSL